MDCSKPSFPVFHYLLELAHTRVHWVGDAIQLSHPLPSPSPSAFNLSQPQGPSNESVLSLCIRWPKYWSFSFSISPPSEYQDWFPSGLTGLISLQLLTKTNVQLEGCERSSVWGTVRTAVQEAASQQALRDGSKAALGEVNIWGSGAGGVQCYEALISQKLFC